MNFTGNYREIEDKITLKLQIRAEKFFGSIL